MAWFGLASLKLLPSVMGTACPTSVYSSARGSGMKVHMPPGQAQAGPAEPPQTTAFTKCEHKCLDELLRSAGGMPAQHKYARSHVFPRTLRLKHLSPLNSRCAPDNVMFGGHSAALSTLLSLLPATCLYACTITQLIAFLLVRPRRMKRRPSALETVTA